MDMPVFAPVQPGEYASNIVEVPQHYRAKFINVLTDEQIVARWNAFDLFDLVNMDETITKRWEGPDLMTLLGARSGGE